MNIDDATILHLLGTDLAKLCLYIDDITEQNETELSPSVSSLSIESVSSTSSFSSQDVRYDIEHKKNRTHRVHRTYKR